MRYIHQLGDWPAFNWRADAITGLLGDIRHRQGRLLGQMENLGFATRGEAILQSLTRSVLDTSAIEGETLDGAQVRSSIGKRLGLDVAGLPTADRAVDGIVEVTMDAADHYLEPLSDERLFGWHAALFPTGRSGTRKLVAGNWRQPDSDPMQVVSGPLSHERIHFEAPGADRVPVEMTRFIDWFNRPAADDSVLQAAIAHLWFVTIHPFEDGNGRIARALTDMMLARSEATPQRFYSMSAQIRAERRSYYDILEASQKGSLDITSWLSWFLACLGRAFEGSEATLEQVLRKAHFWTAHESDGLNDRQRDMLNRLLDGFHGKLTTSKWAQIAKCSPDTALRDIDALIRLNILVRDNAGGRSTSYSLAPAVPRT